MARLVMERHDIVPQLAEIFRTYGFEGTSLSCITEKTGLGKGSLYHFFPGGKDEMAQAVLTHIQDWFEIWIFHPLETDRPLQAIMDMVSHIEDYFCSGRRICLVGAFALEQTRDRFAKAVSGYFTRWLAVLTRALVRAGVDEVEAAARAGEMVAGIQGAIVLARACDDDQLFTAIITRLQDHCLKGL